MADDATANENWTKPESYDYTALQAAPDERNQWDGSARVYEFDGEMGDVGPEFPELEIELFGAVEERKEVKGVDFMKLVQIEVVQEGPVQISPIHSFKDAGLHPVMLRNVELAGYEAPTPIQKFTIPGILQGYDVVGVAQTGSGKTAAYLIPILSRLMGKAKKLAAPRPNPATYRAGIDPLVRAEPLVVIVVPTRELAIQIFNECRKFCYRTMLRPCVCYGGGPIGEQLAIIGKGCDVLVGTPGRLIDFIQRPGNLTLRRVKYMVIDEADEMLQVDWEEQFQKIMTGGDQEEGSVKYMLFSATFPKGARDLAKTYLTASHVRFRVGRAGSSHENIDQVVIEAGPYEKRQALLDSLKSLPPCRTIIFVNSKRTADELDDFLFNMGLPCTSMHADRTQVEREAAMRGFRSGRAPILIATGVSARGIDVRNVLHVVNYDLPSMDHGGIEEYTHRIGRTGRIGHRGRATSFFTHHDEAIASVLTRTLLETKQPVPDFLQSHIPEVQDGRIKFETESDYDEMEGQDSAGGGGWGAGDSTTAPQEMDSSAAMAPQEDWGAPAPVVQANQVSGGSFGQPTTGEWDTPATSGFTTNRPLAATTAPSQDGWGAPAQVPQVNPKPNIPAATTVQNPVNGNGGQPSAGSWGSPGQGRGANMVPAAGYGNGNGHSNGHTNGHTNSATRGQAGVTYGPPAGTGYAPPKQASPKQVPLVRSSMHGSAHPGRTAPAQFSSSPGLSPTAQTFQPPSIASVIAPRPKAAQVDADYWGPTTGTW